MLIQSGRPLGERDWPFLTSDEASIRRLTRAVGSNYRHDEKTRRALEERGAPAHRNTQLSTRSPLRTQRFGLSTTSRAFLPRRWPPGRPRPLVHPRR